ncbi:MAG: hypothetical protein M1834_008159 [Cirrosporium novae-zelandiae]|nr:MAG: hypothetical protein M1834_008159 [Cirrosporium novae-zelandiae]
MAEKCVHKGCGKAFTDPEEECVYHPGPPVFHEGQKGWKCCKPRVLTFDEFLSIPPCTKGKHSTVDDTPTPPTTSEESKETEINIPITPPARTLATDALPAVSAILSAEPPAPKPAPEPESDSDDPSLSIAPNTCCRRRGCNATYNPDSNREEEECIFHPGAPLFHEGSKGWTCCKRRVLEFDQFMKIEGCNKKARHLFVGRGKKAEVEELQSVRHDYYQTSSTVIASLYLKKIDKSNAKVEFSAPNIVKLDLPTADNKRYTASVPLFGPIDPERSSFKILGTKLELNLIKTDGSSWPVFRSDEKRTGEIFQIGKAGKV